MSTLLSSLLATLDTAYNEDANGYPSSVPSSNNTVAIFYLDCRSNKDPWPKGFDFSLEKGIGLDMLGEKQVRKGYCEDEAREERSDELRILLVATVETLHNVSDTARYPRRSFARSLVRSFARRPSQWTWFEVNLRKSNARVNIVMNGLQVLSQSRVPNGNLAEDWEKFPQSKTRLLNSVMNSGVKAPILLTGDVHMSQLLRVTCTAQSSVRTLYELTTSGITHSWSTFFSPQPEHREFWFYPYMCFLSSTFMHLSHIVMPWNEVNVDEKTGQKDYSIELNYAKLDFAEIEKGRVLAEVMTPDGVAISKTFQLNDIDPVVGEGGEYDCQPYRGSVSNLHLIVGYFFTVGFLLVFALGPVLSVIGGGLYVLWRVVAKVTKMVRR